MIPTLGRRASLLRVLACLDEQRSPSSFEVVVVEDAAEAEDSSPPAEGRGYDLRVLRASRPGASAARNAGVAAARSALILFLDDDVLPSPELVREHIAWHGDRPEPEIGVLGHVTWAAELKVTTFMHWLDHGIQFDYRSIAGGEAGWGRFYTANVSVKRSMIEAVGGFDEVRLPFGYEDLDLAYRMANRGFRLLYNPAAAAEHLHEMDLDFWKRRVRRIARAEHRFCRLHPEIPPHFEPMFRGAAGSPRASGRGAALIRILPRSFPVAGERAWRSADTAFKQALAPDFLDAWDEAEREPEAAGAQPDLSERVPASSGGSSPSGPK